MKTVNLGFAVFKMLQPELAEIIVKEAVDISGEQMQQLLAWMTEHVAALPAGR